MVCATTRNDDSPIGSPLAVREVKLPTGGTSWEMGCSPSMLALPAITRPVEASMTWTADRSSFGTLS